MNKISRIFILPVALLIFLGGAAMAQEGAPVSRNPVKDAATACEKLFMLPAADSNIYFRADLPGNDFLTIRFRRLSYWQDESLSDIVTMANAAWQCVKDSFVNTTTSRKLVVHLPPSGSPVIAAITEWGGEQRTLLLKGGRAQPLRIAVDTIVVLKTLPAIGGDTGRSRQIQYTFLLKDLSEIEGIVGNARLINNVSQTFDSLAAATRKRWKQLDAPYHMMEAQYDVRNGISPTLRVNRSGSVLDNFEYNAELGASFIAGKVAGAADLRLSYYIRSRGVAEKGFVALSVSSISFASETNGELQLRGLVFANVELGSVFSGASGHIPLYRTSVGLGYRVAAQDEGPYDFKYRGFFNYSVSRAITVTPEFYIIPKDGEKEGKAFYGVTMSVRLF